MSEPYIEQVDPRDARGTAMVDELLEREGIRRDRNLDYTCAMYDENGRAIATGSCFGSTLRCFAVSSAHQGEGLLNRVVTHLIEWHSLMADGPAEYLREHAYEYARWMFGTDFGWVRG